jgi:small-conductance mechanosensitive channel
MDIQQRINLDLHRRFEEEGIEFAYPTQVVHIDPAQGGSEALTG